MEFFKTKTHIDFMSQRKLAAVFSVVIFVASIEFSTHLEIKYFIHHIKIIYTSND